MNLYYTLPSLSSDFILENKEKLDDFKEELTEEKFLELLEKLYNEKDFYKISLLRYINDFSTDELEDSRIKEILDIFDLFYVNQNGGFYNCDISKIYNKSFDSYNDFIGLKIRTLSELVAIKGYMIAQLFATNPQLAAHGFEITREFEESKVCYAILTLCDLSSLEDTVLEEKEWFIRFFSFNTIIKGYINFYNDSEVNKLINVLFPKLFLGTSFNIIALDELFKKLLNKKEEDLIEKLCEYCENKILDLEFIYLGLKKAKKPSLINLLKIRKETSIDAHSKALEAFYTNVMKKEEMPSDKDMVYIELKKNIKDKNILSTLEFFLSEEKIIRKLGDE